MDKTIGEIEKKIKHRDAEIKQIDEKIKHAEAEIKQIDKKIEQGNKNLKELLTISDNDALRVFEAEIKQLDHLIDISKFFITLSATAIFAVLGLPTIVSESPLLILSLLILVTATGCLIIKMKERYKVVKKYSDYYSSDTRLKGYKSIYNLKNE